MVHLGVGRVHARVGTVYARVFLQSAIAHWLVDPAVLLERLAATVVDEARCRAARDGIEAAPHGW